MGGEDRFVLWYISLLKRRKQRVMPISEDMQRIIMTTGNSLELAEQAQREGVRDLRQSGLLKVKQGVTSLEEVLATTNE